jgi:hypothetical protein
MQTETLELELSKSGANFSALGLTLPEELPVENWVHLGQQLNRSNQLVNWWMGDWAAYGQRKYGRLKEFAEANGIDYGYLRDMVWVSESVELSPRRDNLEWTFYRDIASLPPKDQTKWINRIVENKLTRSQLRTQIRQSKGETNGLVSEGQTLKLLSKFHDDFWRELKSKPTEFWTPERKKIWRDRLTPLVEFWEGLE